MSARNLTSGFAAALLQPNVRPFDLIEIGFAGGTQYLCGLDFPVDYGGHTYTPALGLMAVEPITETSTSYEGLSLTVAGVSSGSVALALTEKMQGRPITHRMAVLDDAGVLQVDANVWSGLMDAPAFTDSPGGAAVKINAEHLMALWDRPQTRRYTHAQQQALYPDDLGLEFIAQMEQATLVWPKAAYFKKQG